MTFPVVSREPSRTHPQASSPSALRLGAGEEVRAQRPTTQPPVMKHQEDGESHQRWPSQTTLSSGYWEAEGKGRGPPCWGGGGQSGGATPPPTPSPGLGPTAAEGQVTGGRRGRVCLPSSIRTARRIPQFQNQVGGARQTGTGQTSLLAKSWIGWQRAPSWLRHALHLVNVLSHEARLSPQNLSASYCALWVEGMEVP